MTSVHHTMTIRRRPWWVWLPAALWLGVEIVLVQTALASSWEGETRAAAISWTVAAVLLAVSLRMWYRLSGRRS